MITTILEVLVAVVVLIVIITFAALHFLRADDSDTFDEMPDEPRRSRRNRDEPALDELAEPVVRGRSRRADPPARSQHQPADDDLTTRMPAARQTAGVGARAAARTTADSLPSSARSSPARSSSAAPAAGRSLAEGSWDSLSDVDYWAELSAESARSADTMLSPDAAGPGRARRESQPGRSRRSTAGHGVPGPAERGPAGRDPVDRDPSRRTRDRALPDRDTSGRSMPDRDFPGRGSSLRPGSAQGVDDRALPGVRAGRGDADAIPGQSRSPRLPETRGQLDRPGRRPAPDAAILGSGSASRSGEQRPASPAWRADGGRLPAEPALPPSRPAAHSGGHPRMPRPADDDPLTSPSFPAINTRDSRSYRDRRPGVPPSGPASASRSASDVPAPALPAAGYPRRSENALPDSYQPSSYRGSSPYSDAAAYGSGYAAGQRAVAGWRSDRGSDPMTGYLPAPTAGPGQYDATPGQHTGGNPYQELSSPYPPPAQPDPRWQRDYRQDGYYSGFRP